MLSFQALASAACMIWLGRIAWIDFWQMRIPNRDVLLLTLVVLLLLALAKGSAALPDLGGAVLLFGIGFAFWVLGLMGAGDAKLFFPVGIIVGWNGLFAFALALLPASLLTLGAILLLPKVLSRPRNFVGRLKEIHEGKGVPYAVPIFLSAAVALLLT